jgi:tetratricopeptide (TPR) repeat protein
LRDNTSSDVANWIQAAVQHHQAGRMHEAEEHYRHVLTLYPDHADALHLLGVIAHQTRQYQSAVELINRAITVNANVAVYHSNLGNALEQLGCLNEAVACYREAIKLNPDFGFAHYNLGNVLRASGRLDEAIASFRSAIDLQPEFPEAHNSLGHVLRDQGKLDEAVARYRAAIELRPDFAEAHTGLADALQQQENLEEAIASYRRALDLKPDYPDALNGLGAAVRELGQLEQAVACFRTAVDLRPDFPEAHVNLGNALLQQDTPERTHNAVACFRRALHFRMDYPDGHLSLAMALLSQGNMAEGWEEHEWRWKTPQMRMARQDFPQPQWHGEPAEGRTLLITAEGGFGDTLQFCRYAPLAAARGLRVIMVVPTPLVRLLTGLQGVDRVIAHNEPLPEFDLQCPMLSLPLALGTNLETVPGASPYLHADKALVAVWRERLAAMTNQDPRVGLVWAGNPRAHSPRRLAVDRRRSLAPEKLKHLFAVTRLHFFSLQKDGPLAPEGTRMTNLMDEIGDFADTAALIANLELIISVDTAVAHLAAALGKPVWLLDRFDPCWRWLSGRRDSPWYPTLRLYRQPHPGDWDAVLAEVARDLGSLAGTARGA